MKTTFAILAVLLFSILDCQAGDWRNGFDGRHRTLIVNDNGEYQFDDHSDLTNKGREGSRLVTVALLVATPLITSMLAINGLKKEAITSGAMGLASVTAFKLLEVQYTFNIGK